MAKKVNTYVKELTPEQIRKLEEILIPQGWTMSQIPYAHWQARMDKTTITAYQSGKLTVQGKGLEDFVLYILEPEILKEASFGYDTEEEENPLEGFAPHAGTDESGKGDYFGPLVISSVYADMDTAEQLLDIGVRDSKAIKSDKKIAGIAAQVMKIVKGKFAIVTIGPEAYNRMYEQFGNLNRMLAWGHARALENLLEKVPECSSALSDKFGDERLIQNALMKNGRNIELLQRTKAESDIAVAAASILARNAFVSKMAAFENELGFTVPKGANAMVVEAARKIVAANGRDALRNYVKLHFKTTEKVLDPF